MNILDECIADIERGGSVVGCARLFDILISSTDEERMTHLFTAWQLKGIDEDEIYAFAKVMRGRCTRVNSRHRVFADIVGTGGSRAKTFNVSTAAAFVAAGAGLPIAKHGNKAATSSSGSADVLSELGIDPTVGRDVAERCLNEIGICFMFAPNHHRLSHTLAKVRRGLGFPTIFNCVGPLCNPADAPHQVIGVWDGALLETMANALAMLGTTRSWVVHADGGLDEIGCDGPTQIAEIENRRVKTFELTPQDFGVEPASVERINCDSPRTSAEMVKLILQNRPNSGRALVLMNAAAVLLVSGFAASLREAMQLATESLTTGAALAKLEELGAATTR